jgi:hypothetical protein
VSATWQWRRVWPMVAAAVVVEEEEEEKEEVSGCVS